MSVAFPKKLCKEERFKNWQVYVAMIFEPNMFDNDNPECQ